MTKVLKEEFDLTGMTEDEIYYQGENFVNGLYELLEEGKAILGNSYQFRLIEQCYRELHKKLLAEERIVV